MRKIKWFANVFNENNENMVDYVEYKSLKDALLYHADDKRAEIFGITENEEVIDVKNIGETLTKKTRRRIIKEIW